MGEDVIIHWHGHNDFHRVYSNAFTAWLCGANAVNGTLFGMGERTGNPPLEAALIDYAALKGDLATRYGTDREGYTDAKSAFISRVLTRARAET